MEMTTKLVSKTAQKQRQTEREAFERGYFAHDKAAGNYARMTVARDKVYPKL